MSEDTISGTGSSTAEHCLRPRSTPVASLGTKNNDLLMTFRTNRELERFTQQFSRV